MMERQIFFKRYLLSLSFLSLFKDFPIFEPRTYNTNQQAGFAY